jgi:very-short-patch-repair endonuclease
MRAADIDGKGTESFFEKSVLQQLTAAGYRVQTQWPVGAYRIDLVVEGETERLAVECDGEKWHTPEHVQSDIERQAVLERLGWKFVRIRGSLFFRDHVAAVAPVFVRLDELGIAPLGTSAANVDSNELVARVRRRAESLRQEWRHNNRDDQIPPVVPEGEATVVTVSSGKSEVQSKAHNDLKEPADSHVTSQKSKVRNVQFPKPNGILIEELAKVDTRFENPACFSCGKSARIEIADEGIVLFCGTCRERKRVDVDALQRLADQLSLTCFSCDAKQLRSTEKSYANILMCPNPGCGRNNTWRGVNDRLSL